MFRDGEASQRGESLSLLLRRFLHRPETQIMADETTDEHRRDPVERLEAERGEDITCMSNYNQTMSIREMRVGLGKAGIRWRVYVPSSQKSLNTWTTPGYRHSRKTMSVQMILLHKHIAHAIGDRTHICAPHPALDRLLQKI